MNPASSRPAFSAITGIKVTHELIGEGDVVDKPAAPDAVAARTSTTPT